MKEKKLVFITETKELLINILKSKLKDLSLKKIKSYVKHGMVEINDKTETNYNRIISSGQKITIHFSKRISPKSKIKIIYEDKDLIAIDKPSGLLTISTSKENENTAFRLVSDYIKEINPKARLFVVHRLDQYTSGVLLFSKNQKLKDTLQNNWNTLVQLREYICVISGNINNEGEFNSYLKEDSTGFVYSTNKDFGKLAITQYKVIKNKNNLSLLKINLKTGRKNQIRVHMSENGTPIVGDKKYGSKINPIGRLALHASYLKIIDPRTEKEITISAEIPSIIEKLIK